MISYHSVRMANGGDVEALMKAAKVVEEQEKQKLRGQIVTPRCRVFCENRGEVKEIPVTIKNGGVHLQIASSRMTTRPNFVKNRSVLREVHAMREKKRRAHLKECFETLKRLLPRSPDEKKTSNLSILHNAIRYIATLEREEREFEHEMKRLVLEKIEYQQYLATLKKELTTQWEHTDLNILLPEVVVLEPRKAGDLINGRMTETGSDEELVRTSTIYSSTSSLSSASPLHFAADHHTQVMSAPILKSIRQVPPLIRLVKPTTVVVRAVNTPK